MASLVTKYLITLPIIGMFCMRERELESPSVVGLLLLKIFPFGNSSMLDTFPRQFRHSLVNITLKVIFSVFKTYKEPTAAFRGEGGCSLTRVCPRLRSHLSWIFSKSMEVNKWFTDKTMLRLTLNTLAHHSLRNPDLNYQKHNFRHVLRMNNHRFDTNHKDLDKPVPIHAGTRNQDFQTYYTIKILRAFPKQCNSSQLGQWELAHQWITTRP
ncbi:unnamed protein product [Timema podura]|uniref:Uncharacterized protein n=1 Tax=Timema podura TaxID=61482 RepID=A0ABN7NGU1_TIMPD|nr:unnamed protein product [Timema podura]